MILCSIYIRISTAPVLAPNTRLPIRPDASAVYLFRLIRQKCGVSGNSIRYAQIKFKMCWHIILCEISRAIIMHAVRKSVVYIYSSTLTFQSSKYYWIFDDLIIGLFRYIHFFRYEHIVLTTNGVFDSWPHLMGLDEL